MPIMFRKLKYRFRRPKKSYCSKPSFLLKALFFTVLFCFIFLLVFHQAEMRIGSVVQEKAMSNLDGVVTAYVNRALQETIADLELDTQKLIIPQKNDSGKILSMTTDFNSVNQLKSRLSLNILEKIHQIEVIEATVPLGLLFSNSIMTGAGFKLKLKVFCFNSVEVDFSDSFSAAGINQTKYSLSSTVTVPMHVVGVGMRKDYEVKVEIPIAQTVVIGDIPNTYLNLKNE